jgi:hypothetical protein
MINEDYVSFETAKLLKEKGFNSVVCKNSPHYYYNMDGEFSGPSWDSEYPAPTLQMAMKWLRVNYSIHIEPRYFPMPNIYRYVIIHSPTTIENIDSHPQYFNTYEEACEAAIKYCLEIFDYDRTNLI